MFGRRQDTTRRPVAIPRLGARVRIVSGRNRGTVGDLTDVQRVTAPSGAHVVVAVVTAGRGDTYAFATDVVELSAVDDAE